jgi:hypothetical protein
MICSMEHTKSELQMSQFADEDYIVFYCHYYVVPFARSTVFPPLSGLAARR